MEHESTFVALLVITALAAIVPLLSSRMRVLRLPIVVGEILAGIVIGQSGLNIVKSSPTLEFLAEFGFAFLMFLSGLEVNFDLLLGNSSGVNGEGRRGRRWQMPMPMAAIVFGGTTFLAMGVGAGLAAANLAGNPLLMGLILSTTSLGIVVPVLKERNLTVTPYGQTLLATALISDFATLLLLSLTFAILSQGFSLNLLLVMFLLAAFVAAGKIGQWLARSRKLSTVMDELSHATSQIRVRGAFALLIGWVALSQAIGVEVLLGAFLAGAAISMSSQGHESPLREKLDAIGFGFFIPIFFITVGANFDLRSLLDSPSALALVPLLTLAAYAVKMLPALLYRTRFSWRETLGAGVLLSSRLSLIVAASAIALEMGLLNPAVNSAIVLVAVVTCTVSPVLFARLLPAARPAARQGIIIYGTTQTAKLLARRVLKVGGDTVTFVSRNDHELAQLQAEGFQTVRGDPKDPTVLARAGAHTARAFVAVPQIEEMMLPVCRLAKSHFLIPEVIAHISDPTSLAELHRAGIRVIQPTMASALALEGALHFPASLSLLMDQSDDVDVADAVLLNSRLAGRALRQTRLPGDVLIMGIRRQGETLVPHGNTVLRAGDVLMLVGNPQGLKEARALVTGEMPVA